MGPRRCRRGRRDKEVGGCGPGQLQWGHADVGVEDRTSTVSQRPTGLQWGHADVGVEDGLTPATVSILMVHRLQWGHADHSVEDVGQFVAEPHAEPRFNGATPMSAWKTPCSSTSAARLASPSFNGATPMTAWKTTGSGLGLPWPSTFNGATPMSAWKTWEPTAIRQRRSISRFNGATPMSSVDDA